MWGVIAMVSQTSQVPLTRQLSGSQCIWSSPQTHWDITLCLASKSDVILYTGLGRKLEAREKMKRPSVNGVPNVPNLLVSFFVGQKEMANSKWHTLMNDTHFFLIQKYFRNVKKEQTLLILLNGQNVFLLEIFSVPVLLFSCVWTKYFLPFSSPIFFAAIYLSASVRVLHCWIRAVDWLLLLMVLLDNLIHGVCNECRK